MKFLGLLWGCRDGGPDSNVKYYGLEFKKLFSVTFLCFGRGSRPVYHSHAFNSISWVLTGGLLESQLDAEGMKYERYMPPRTTLKRYLPSRRPVYTYRTTYHMVEGIQDKNWVLSFRGPWADRWYEFHPDIDRSIVLTHGRKVVEDVQ